MDRDNVLIENFAYHDCHRRTCHCTIEAMKCIDGRVAVIATEVADNPGMSITNAAEYVATAVCRRLNIDPFHLVWIEYYGYPVPGNSGRRRTYDLVTFASITPEREHIFHEPKWRVMLPADWQSLGLAPRISPF